jgi:hypothetical protein
MLHSYRWLAVGVLAVLAAAAFPARSQAGITILVEEIDASGKVLSGPLNSQTFTSSSVSGVATTNFGQIGISAASNSAINTPSSSISTGFSFLNTTSISAGDLSGLGLRITVTDTFSRPPGGEPASINSSIGAANGSAGFSGSLEVTNQTDVLGPGGTSLTPSGSTPPVASTVSPSGVSSGPQFLNVSALPQDFQIQQTITIRLTSTGTTVPSSGFSGAVASGTAPPENTPVPAPGGLVLALAALPALGLRRVLRKKATA